MSAFTFEGENGRSKRPTGKLKRRLTTLMKVSHVNLHPYWGYSVNFKHRIKHIEIVLLQEMYIVNNLSGYLYTGAYSLRFCKQYAWINMSIFFGFTRVHRYSNNGSMVRYFNRYIFQRRRLYSILNMFQCKWWLVARWDRHYFILRVLIPNCTLLIYRFHSGTDHRAFVKKGFLRHS